MIELLSQSGKRQLLAMELLHKEKDWITLSEVAKKLDCSVRVLKADIAHFKDVFDDFTIEGSNKGVRLVMNHNIGLRSFYQYTLTRSDAYRLIEYVFLNEGVSVVDLTEYLSLGSSTVYRLLDHINEVFEGEGFQIDTNPCQVVGSEENIRYFFYNYFAEKYSFMDWPYMSVDKTIFDRLLQFFIRFTDLKADFAYYNTFRTITVVNFIRYKQGHMIDTKNLEVNFKEIIPDLSKYQADFLEFEKTNHIEVDHILLKQVFTPYIRESYSLSYERLMEKTTTDPKILEEVTFLEHFLDEVAEIHNIQLTNKEEILLDLHNASSLEYQEPRAGYIFDNYNHVFAEQVKDKFPDFYERLYNGVKAFRQLMKMQDTEDGIQFMIYLIFTIWPNLLTEFRRKFEDIQILVLSDRHIAHAEMIKDLLDFEFNEKIVVDVYRALSLNETILENLAYDILIANFPLPSVPGRRTIYVEALPTFSDIINVSKIIDEIFEYRIKKRQKED